MPNTMPAVVKTGRGVGLVELQEKPVPVPGPGEVLIRVRSVSVCGSDLHIYHDAHPYSPPMILGHEFSGEIAALGPGVASRSEGDRVVSETRTHTCGRCIPCITGFPQCCTEKRPPGIGRDGAYAPYVVMPEELLHSIPPSVGFDEACLAEPAAVVMHSLVERVGIGAGDSVLITGPGPIGLLSLMVARAAGAASVAVSGTRRSRSLKLAMARDLGADHTFVSGEDDVPSRMKEISGGQGADVAVECAGSTAAIFDCFRSVRRLGRIGVLAITGGGEATVPWDEMVFRAARLTFCFSSSWTAWERVLALLARKALPLESIITHRLPLENWLDGFEALEQGRAVKVIMHP
ncbi:MAG: alcohol dehydrogenase catalytic domain-containing protein [Planctomycetes bacterium]|nr:alcohol dehydrogenase catalytic domain-containing protein [Planctomycetota bacterium]